MFFVSDTQEQRHKLIRSFLTKDRAPIAVILAAVDFEWTVRRAILALGTSPTKDIRKDFKKVYGLERYKEKWNEEVRPQLGVTLVQVVPQWSNLKRAFDIRDILVHGVSGAVTPEYAAPHLDHILTASTSLEGLAKEKDKRTLYRHIVRLKTRDSGNRQASHSSLPLT